MGNRGTRPATDVVVNDTLPDYLDLEGVSASRGTTFTEGRVIRVDIGTVAPGEIVTIQVQARVNERVPATGGYNSVEITTTSSGDDTSNNTDTAIFTLPGSTATPIPAPLQLPITGAPADSGEEPWFLIIGVILLATGLALRRRARA